MSKNEIYYQASRDTIQYQDEVHQDFSSRATNLIGYGVAMLAATAIALNLPEEEISWNWEMYVSLGGLAGGFGLLILCCGFVLWPGRWERGPRVDSLGNLVGDTNYDVDKVLWFIADSFRKSFVHNEKVLKRKARAIGLAVMALALESMGVIAVGVLLFLAVGLHQGSAGECIAPMD